MLSTIDVLPANTTDLFGQLTNQRVIILDGSIDPLTSSQEMVLLASSTELLYRIPLDWTMPWSVISMNLAWLWPVKPFQVYAHAPILQN